MRALRECRVPCAGAKSACERVLGAKGSRRRVCPQVCVNALVYVMSCGSGCDKAQMHCPAYEVCIRVIKRVTECGQGEVSVRQTDTGGTESQVSVMLGVLGQGSASVWPQCLHLQHGIGVGRRLNSGGLSIFNVL